MKQQICENEKVFIVDGLKQGIRRDGRGNLDFREFKIELGTIPHAFGSSSLIFGEEDINIICAIKADLQKPLPSEPNKGQIRFHLESSQTGSSLFTREEQSELNKNRLTSILNALYGNIINREELKVFEGQFCWFLNVDILVMEELSLQQIDFIGLAIRSAFLDFQLPSVNATLNNNTGKIEVGLVEEIYEDQENTDKLETLKSAKNSPYILSIGFIRDEAEDVVVIDADDQENQCFDQLLHISVDNNLRIYGIEQSKGRSLQSGLLSSKFFLQGNLTKILKPKIIEFERISQKLIKY
ncbi:UNKNOWN [Stylonychia lemnae]|uniref:Ribosomal RNA-processing protein 42 n=1 Tax=Stylonychia lemnae TaxID=5949 RepID=A0A078AR36_STYLE|nr:UNKNOWN [Stylonychia lemnae]|eukprot:CDW84684.1 UNKNOWN [Stylonychia lemnae]